MGSDAACDFDLRLRMTTMTAVMTMATEMMALTRMIMMFVGIVGVGVGVVGCMGVMNSHLVGPTSSHLAFLLISG
jgi:hypothetical protein